MKTASVLSFVIGIVAAVLFAGGVALSLLKLGPLHPLGALLISCVICTGAFVVLQATRFAVLMLAARCIRGPGAVIWTTPAKCPSLWRWMFDSWEAGEREAGEGERMMGIEVRLGAG